MAVQPLMNGSLHRIDVGNVADISKVYTIPNFVPNVMFLQATGEKKGHLKLKTIRIKLRIPAAPKNIPTLVQQAENSHEFLFRRPLLSMQNRTVSMPYRAVVLSQNLEAS
jgi:hypothetical protein